MDSNRPDSNCAHAPVERQPVLAPHSSFHPEQRLAMVRSPSGAVHERYVSHTSLMMTLGQSMWMRHGRGGLGPGLALGPILADAAHVDRCDGHMYVLL